jgi:2-polyprenyl-3-methyl-5-hydroxy-6-metoxy-1,4-benzoquinol methylase
MVSTMDGRVGAPAAERWALELQQWGIPAHIIEQAPQSPWIHPTESFRPTAEPTVAVTPSYRRALEALDDAQQHGDGDGSVLDVGCGGGRASLVLVPPARLLVGVDQQASMLEMFAAEATARGIEARTVLGAWPAAAAQVPVCDVVVCHHVLFNVADLVPFVVALTEHARRRVVVEMPMQHPLANLSAAWKRFWDLDRPTGPTAHDAAAVLREAGLAVNVDEFDQPDPKASRSEVTDSDVEHTRVRLCLTADRDPEVRAFLEQLPRPPRRIATLWWDV